MVAFSTTAVVSLLAVVPGETPSPLLVVIVVAVMNSLANTLL